MSLLERLMRFEEGWDARLGGIVTRGHRELFAYAVGRIRQVSGCSIDDLIEYLESAEEVIGARVDPDDEPVGDA